MEDHQRIADLIARYQAGICTEAERALVDRVLFTLAEGETLSPEALRSKEDVWAALQTAIREERPVRPLRRWLPYAAAAVLALAVGAWLLLVDSRQSSVDSLAANEILPGGNRAVLTLADGRVIDLSSEQEGIVMQDGIQYLDGSAVPHNLTAAQTHMLALTTPKGGTYQITLPDGSKVWLNAASTLKYPSRFSGDAREVFLEGEAFFEIKKQPIKGQGWDVETHDYASFNVRTTGQTVEVLGTQFNLSAYPDEEATKTTLVEGKVRVVGLVEAQDFAPNKANHAPDKSSVILSPGQQATNRGAAITIHEVDTEPFIAWRDGLIVLDRADLPTIIRQLERWYDVTFEGEPIPAGIVMDGEVPRDVPLATVLRALELNTGIHFQINGRRVLMSQ